MQLNNSDTKFDRIYNIAHRAIASFKVKTIIIVNVMNVKSEMSNECEISNVI